MNLFVKASAITLICLILWLLLEKQNKETALILSILSCSFLFIVAASYLEPIIDFIERMGKLANLSQNMIATILKAMGVSILSEIICSLCADSGNAAIGKTLYMLATAVILWLAVPLLDELMTLIDQILGAL